VPNATDPSDLDFTSFFDKREVPVVTPAQKAKIAEEAMIGENEITRGGFCVSMARPGLRPLKPINGKTQVLVVEDEPLTSSMIQRMLSGAGYEPVPAASGKEVVEKLRNPRLPDLILMDVMLPDIDGFKILERIRAHKVIGDIPVVMVSGQAEMTDISRGFTAGADGYVTKPTTRKALLGVIEQVMSGRKTGE
jgi:two-component system, OmpR family, response regulator